MWFRQNQSRHIRHVDGSRPCKRICDGDVVDGAPVPASTVRTHSGQPTGGGFRLRSIDGIELDGWLHVPAEGAPLCLAVLAHGISADMDEGGMFARLGDKLAQHRIASGPVLVPRPREQRRLAARSDRGRRDARR